MYEEHFGLSAPPFRLNPDPKFFFGSKSHNKAMAYLHYGLKQAEGFIVITGPIGSGKSMVISHLIDQLNQSNVVAAHLLTSRIRPEELLSQILSAFRIEPEGEGRTGELEAFEDYLFDQMNRGRRVLLVVDEAQNLPHETIEELRMLSNIDYDGTPLFQVFLVGQPEFKSVVEAPELEQLRQRVIASYHLETLSPEETREYILHRLAVVGWNGDPEFTDGAISAIHEETNGLPRRINTLCNRIMIYCAMEDVHEVSRDVVRSIISDMMSDEKAGDQSVASMSNGAAEPAPKPVVDAEPVKAPPQVSPAKPKKKMDLAPVDESAAEPAPEKKSKAKNEKPPQAKKPEVVQGEPVAKKRENDTTPKIAATQSVFDRLRNKKAVDEPVAEKETPPHTATLNEIASAIAAASGEVVKVPEIDADDSNRNGDGAEIATLPPRVEDITTVKDGSAKKSVFRYVNDTRSDIKKAHESVARLRKTMLKFERAREEQRGKISASLGRAESLLNELRDSWR